jgi:hypothetical protein
VFDDGCDKTICDLEFKIFGRCSKILIGMPIIFLIAKNEQEMKKIRGLNAQGFSIFLKKICDLDFFFLCGRLFFCCSFASRV